MHGLVHCCAFHILYSTWCNTSGTLALFQASGHLVVHHDCPFNQLVLLQFSISQLPIEGAGIIHSTDLSGTVRARQPVGEGPKKLKSLFFSLSCCFSMWKCPGTQKFGQNFFHLLKNKENRLLSFNLDLALQNLFWALNDKKMARW